MSTIFIAIALVTAGLAILTVVAALLVLLGVIVVREADREESVAPPSDPRSTAPTLQFQPNPPARRVPASTELLRPPLDTLAPDDPTTAPRVGRDEVPPYADSSVSHERRPTEMFGTNAGSFSGFDIGENDDSA
ncbi:MAG: hypothetical protein AAF602_25280 [Myxococcota bacterium]